MKSNVIVIGMGKRANMQGSNKDVVGQYEIKGMAFS